MMCSLSHWSRKATSFSSYINKWISTRDSSTLKRVSVSLSENLALNVILPNESLAQENSTSTPLLCIPSAFGSAEHNFKQQFEVFADKFPMVAIDPRGYGGSRPPVRDFPANYFERDAQDIALAMEKLGYEKYNILGWSAGANTGAVLAAKFPEHVERLVLVNGNAFVSDEDLEAFELYRDVSNWHPKLREEGESVYGAEGLWEIMFQALRTIYEQEDGDLYCGFLPRIQCKTLVVGGGKDKLVADFHAEYLNERILHSRLHVFPEGRHDVLLSLHEEFNQVLGDFLEEPDDKLTQSREYVAKPMKS